jgi:hypothetical protein
MEVCPMMRFHSWPFLRLHAGAALDPVETGSPLPHRVPFVLIIAFLLMLAVGTVAPAWATPQEARAEPLRVFVLRAELTGSRSCVQ